MENTDDYSHTGHWLLQRINFSLSIYVMTDAFHISSYDEKEQLLRIHIADREKCRIFENDM